MTPTVKCNLENPDIRKNFEIELKQLLERYDILIYPESCFIPYGGNLPLVALTSNKGQKIEVEVILKENDAVPFSLNVFGV